jgi:hypothetical protein
MSGSEPEDRPGTFVCLILSHCKAVKYYIDFPSSCAYS